MSLTIRRVEDPDFSLMNVKALFKDYHRFLNIDLAFQDFENEINDLPGKYHPSKRGQLYLACWDNSPVGCTGTYQFADTICELKRLYVKPELQGKKIGLFLLETAIQDAKAIGYHQLYLDSLKRLEAARQLYFKLGFKEITPYNENPHSDVYYMALDLKTKPDNGHSSLEKLDKTF